MSDVDLPVETVSQAEYARHRGITRQSVNEAVGNGRIPVDENGRIDPALADHALGVTARRVDEPREPAFAPAAVSPDAALLTKARAHEAVTSARAATLRLEEQTGKLLRRDDFRQALQTVAADIALELDRLPHLADDIFAAGAHNGVEGVRDALKAKRDELRRHLNAAMTALAASAPPRLEVRAA